MFRREIGFQMKTIFPFIIRSLEGERNRNRKDVCASSLINSGKRTNFGQAKKIWSILIEHQEKGNMLKLCVKKNYAY
jgi:hypothetical protein